MRKILYLMCLMVCFSTACAPGAKKPFYENVATDEPFSILLLNNQCSMNFFSPEPYLSVDLDGFSPSKKKWLPSGVTELRITPGSHQMNVKGEFKTKRPGHYDPVAINFRTEPGKTYKITFDFFRDGPIRGGFNILYEGWSVEDRTKFPQKSMYYDDRYS